MPAFATNTSRSALARKSFFVVRLSLKLAIGVWSVLRGWRQLHFGSNYFGGFSVKFFSQWRISYGKAWALV